MFEDSSLFVLIAAFAGITLLFIFKCARWNWRVDWDADSKSAAELDCQRDDYRDKGRLAVDYK